MRSEAHQCSRPYCGDEMGGGLSAQDSEALTLHLDSQFVSNFSLPHCSTHTYAQLRPPISVKFRE